MKNEKDNRASVERIVHTPGPWKAVRSLTCGHLRAAHNYQTDPTKEWTDEDLVLISAAPELLRLLIEARDSLCVLSHEDYIADLIERIDAIV